MENCISFLNEPHSYHHTGSEVNSNSEDECAVCNSLGVKYNLKLNDFFQLQHHCFNHFFQFYNQSFQS